MIPNKPYRSRFCHTISLLSAAAQPLRTDRLDFFGSVTLVCGIGVLAKLVQALIAN